MDQDVHILIVLNIDYPTLIKKVISHNLHYEQIGKNIKCIEDELPFEIPDNWEWTRFESVFTLKSGQDLPTKLFNSTGEGIAYLTGASNIHNGVVLINRWTEYPKSIANYGELLLTCKGTVGKLAFLNVDQAHIARQIMSISSLHKFNLEYLKIVFETNIKSLKTKAKSMIPGISRENILNMLIPIPPLEEQKRIIKILNNILKIVE